MAEQTGVQHAEPRSEGGSQKLTAKKNKKWLYLGGAGVAILLLGHKGGSSGSSSGLDPNAALQAQSDFAAQQQADAGLAGALEPGGVAPTTITTGDGTDSPNATSGTTSSDGTGSGVDNTAGASSDASNALAGADVALDSALAAQLASKAPPANEAPKHNKGKPVKNKGKNAGKTNHPSSGAKVQGHTGASVHGRHFPGARSVNVGAPRVVNGNVHEDVTVNYGGHTAVHTSVNSGKHWIESTKGRNPPSRGPQNTRSIPRPAATPHPAAHPAPVHVAPVHASPAHPAPRPAPRRRG